jgi:hypothetical protein
MKNGMTLSNTRQDSVAGHELHSLSTTKKSVGTHNKSPSTRLVRIYRVYNNPKSDDLDTLVKRTGAEDRAKLVARWRRRPFDKTGGYSMFTEYAFAYLDIVAPAPWEETTSFFKWGRVSQASSREMLAFFLCNGRNARVLLREGFRIIALGKDEFNFFGFGGITLRLEGSGVVIEALDETVDKLVSPKDIFLTRFHQRLEK